VHATIHGSALANTAASLSSPRCVHGEFVCVCVCVCARARACVGVFVGGGEYRFRTTHMHLADWDVRLRTCFHEDPRKCLHTQLCNGVVVFGSSECTFWVVGGCVGSILFFFLVSRLSELM
jgi:hypothetical protein